MDREQLVQLNKDIALHAKRKELDEAMALFQQALDAKAENSHTYSNAINANIRCGNLDGAEKVMEIMKKRGRKRDVIICTTMIKGYCGAGLVNKAVEMLNDMTERKPIVSPNLRTINTLLRGCVQTGDVSIAELLVARAQKDLKISLDVSSWEYLTSLLSQSLKLEKALPVVGRLKDDLTCVSGLAGMYVNIARAAAVLGDWKVCKKSIASALSAIDKAADSTTTATVEDEEDGDDKTQLKTEKNTGGKRAWNSAEVDERRAESLELYREHLKAELKAELTIIDEFMERMKKSQLSSFQYIFPYFLRMFPLASTADTAATAVSSSTGSNKKKESGNLKKEIVKPIMYSVEQNFGLDVFARRLTQKSCDALNGYALVEAAPVAPAPTKKSKSKKEKEKEKRKKAQQEQAVVSGGDTAAEDSEKPQEPVAAPVLVTPTPPVEEKEKPILTPLEAQIASFRALSAKAFDSSGKFIFKNVFSHTSAAETGSAPALSKPISTADREVKVEVCSGAGEWITAQAKNDPNSDWVALELRHDRAYQTLTKAVFAGVPNLAVLCGDAMRILPAHMPTSSITSLFVNHPEPPQQTGGRGGESQNRHLLEKAFFLEACRILKPNGMLTIVTDNLWYGRLLMRLVGGIPLNAYTDSSAPGQQQTPLCLHSASVPITAVSGLESEWTVQETENGVSLYVGKPGAAAGHVAEASSYFDRLWKRGNLVERYFLVLRKIPVSSVPAPGVLHAAAAAKKRPAGSIEVNVLPKGMENVKNSRIKFD